MYPLFLRIFEEVRLATIELLGSLPATFVSNFDVALFGRNQLNANPLNFCKNPISSMLQRVYTQYFGNSHH